MGKSKTTSFFSNLWYYHKWHILVGALVLLVLAVTVTQCIKKDEPDVCILYVGDMDIGKTGRESVKATFADYYGDVTGDGNKSLIITFMGEKDKDTKERLQIEVVAGDHSIYFLNKEYFEWLQPYKVLAPLEDVLGVMPEGAVNEYGIELKYLDIAEKDGFNAMPRDTVVCLRANAEDGAFDYNSATPFYKNNVDFFIKLIQYKEEGFTRENVQMTMIGDRNLYENCISDIEHSLYYIAKQNDPKKAPLLDYGFLQLKYKEGQHIFGDEEKQKTEEMARGNKLLLLDVDAYTYLSNKGLLLDVNTVNADLPDGGEQYGIQLSKLPLFKVNGFYFADDRENSRIYLCASKDAEGYTVSLLKYLYEFKA